MSHSKSRKPGKYHETFYNPTFPDAKRKRKREQEQIETHQLKNGGKDTYTDPAVLFPLPQPGEDPDDMKEFFVTPKSPRQVDDSTYKKEDHMPDDAVTTEHQFPEPEEYKELFGVDPRQKDGWQKPVLLDKKGTTGKPKLKSRWHYRPPDSMGYDAMRSPAFDEKWAAIQMYEPLEFEKLMNELLQWYIQSGTDYQIFPFHVLVCCDYLWLAMGKRRTGKTTLWKTVIPQISPMYPFVYVFAGTKFNSAFKAYVPDKVVFKGFREGVVTEIMAKQEEKIELNLRLFDRFNEYEDPEALQMLPNPYIHCVFDDCVADKQCHSSEILDELAFYGRHYRCSTWINTQHGHALNPVCYVSLFVLIVSCICLS